MRHWKIITPIASILVSVGLAGLSRFISLPLAVLLWGISVGLVCWSALPLLGRVSIKKGANKMLIVLGALIIIGGIIGGGFLIKSQLDIKTTIVYCCIRSNEYQVWAVNHGDDKDTVFVTLGTGSTITEVKALMGAGMPTIIEGGPNGNFITFKISELPPGVSLGYLIDVVSNAEEPYKFTAWSETKTSNVKTRFVDECPKITGVGPEETAPGR